MKKILTKKIKYKDFSGFLRRGLKNVGLHFWKYKKGFLL